MLVVSAIIGIILGTIFFGILMSIFTYFVPVFDLSRGLFAYRNSFSTK